MTGGVRGKRGAAQPAKKIGQRGSSPGEGGGSGRGVNGNSPGATLGQRTKERGEGGFAPPNRVGAAREGDLTGSFGSAEGKRPGGASVAFGERRKGVSK
jgi:hypothetical protein